MRPVGSAAELERRRRHAVDLLNRGEKPSIIIRILDITWTSLCRWRKEAATGENGLAAKPREGHARLSTDQLATLVTELKKGPLAHGWPNELWTGERVAVLIEQLFQVRYTPDHVRVLLRKKLGWTSQKPEVRGRERNESEIAHWRKEEFPRIKKNAEKRGAHIVFLDESGFLLTPTVQRTYAPRGETPIQKCWSNHGRISVISAITLSPRSHRPSLYFKLLPDNAGAKAEDTVDFLNLLRRHLGPSLIICWDRGRIHDKSLLVRQWLAKHRRIRTEHFPAYAPDVNPDEFVWAHTKYERLCNYAAPTLYDLRERIANELKQLSKTRKILNACIEHAKLVMKKIKVTL